MSSKASEMVGLVQSYCGLIEASSSESTSWLKEVAVLLPRLHSAINAIDGSADYRDSVLAPDLEARFELYSHLVDLLGDRDSYRLEFDLTDDCDAMTGSLADDLTDIYCELKHGLRTLDEDPERSLHAWVEGFSRHWGQHLTDAERHLSTLAVEGRLEHPAPQTEKKGR